MEDLNLVRLIKFNSFENYNGVLIPIEGKVEIPFSIKRIFYIFKLKKGNIRGKHAHKNCNQILICLNGECEVVCQNGKDKKNIILRNPRQGVYIPPMIWITQKFKKDDSILLVLTDKNFTESDYLRDYKKFLASI